MRIFTTKLLGLALTGLILSSCSQMATFDDADLANEQAVAEKAGFKLTPFGATNGVNLRTICGEATTKNVRRLQGSAAIQAADYGDIVVSNDQTNIYIDITPSGISPLSYAYFLGNHTSLANLGALNTVLTANTSASPSFVIPIAAIADVYPAIAGVNFDLGVVLQLEDGTRYWGEGTSFSGTIPGQQGRHFVYTIQTDCPEPNCFGPEEGSWTEGFEYNPGKNFSEYSSLSDLLLGVKLQAGAQYTHVGNAIAAEELGEQGEELVKITVTLLSGYVFGDESFDEEGNLLPGSLFVQPFGQSDVDNGTIPGLQNNNNPAPGQFLYKFNNVTGSSYTISGIPKADYYGIKTAVQAIIECPAN